MKFDHALEKYPHVVSRQSWYNETHDNEIMRFICLKEEERQIDCVMAVRFFSEICAMVGRRW